MPARSTTRRNPKERTAFLPSIFYNLGRVVSYTFIGFLLGLIGWLIGGDSEAGVPVFMQGILQLIAGVFMVIMGINMLGIFPWLRKLNIHMPKCISKRIGQKKATAVRPFAVGLLNGLMPCGPLQSMQILALASANPFTGALSMLLFSLGTAPLMLGLGSVVTVLGKRFTHSIMNIGAVLVTVLGFAMLAQGGSLSGLISSEILLFMITGLSVVGIVSIIPFTKKAYRIISVITAFVLVLTAGIVWQHSDQKAPSTDSSAQVVDGVQNIESTLLPGQYPMITVKEDIPVKWTINAPDGSINGCNNKMIISEYGIEHTFQEGENIIEFTPTEAGTFIYTCWMGMIKGKIIVTETTDDDYSVSENSDASNNENSANDSNIQIIAEGEYLTLPISKINETATFYPFTVDGMQMEILAVKASDGTVRTAFNTCQACYASGRGCYVQNGNHLVCRNCGSRFSADEVENVTGGCNPVPILEENKTVTEDSVQISYDFLKEYTDIFTNWKK
ncbi:MAG: Fe-S-containing protein [Eubacteriales bacterium]